MPVQYVTSGQPLGELPNDNSVMCIKQRIANFSQNVSCLQTSDSSVHTTLSLQLFLK